MFSLKMKLKDDINMEDNPRTKAYKERETTGSKDPEKQMCSTPARAPRRLGSRSTQAHAPHRLALHAGPRSTSSPLPVLAVLLTDMQLLLPAPSLVVTFRVSRERVPPFFLTLLFA